MAGTLKGQRGKGGGGIGPEETLVAHALNGRGQRFDPHGQDFIAGPLGGGNDGAGRRSEDDPNLVTQEGVRRLTPRECERLQSLPDDWTLVEWRGKPAPDGRRYAALGDAVTSNVGEWIGRRLEAVGR